ncbi:carbohydrate-binding module family 13 protein [Rhizophagus clarus]|uniref:Carbohydrate-binding module family 13 protein n=1 Tax=Rhizophagus clarus TaxID=94130 RepID=A0A8H3M067_9GLOM|nr:carbohydrate-binding module family 13 protein [Rhizophagus clarus]
MDDDKFLPKLSQNLLKILDDDEYHDIIIEVGNDPYKNKETLVHIKLPNILPEIFQIILRYIYGGRLSLDECDTLRIIKVLVAAKLQKYCTNLISKRPDKILKSISFSSIPEKLLISIIRNNNHQMSEIQVWKYVLKWGLAQNPELSTDPATFSKEDFNILKNTLQHIVPFIKFNDLTSREFSDEVLPYKKILPKELYKDLLKKFLNLHPDSKLTDNLKSIDSKIITFQHAELISKWIEKFDITHESTSLYEFKLLLRGSRDGFTPNKFHEICDNRSCTITIIKAKGNNQILGGYNPIEWKSERGYVATKDSFIFSFENGNDINNHILSRVINKNYAIFNDHTYGPSFGCADLILRGDSGHCIKDSYEKRIRGALESALHYSIRCDCCNYTIRGERWKCTSCADYDLCQICKPKSHIHNHPAGHRFQLIPHSKTSHRAPQFLKHYVICDSCNKSICGMRWKCTFCEKYNLCQDCKFKSSNIHDNNHAFRPIAYLEHIPLSFSENAPTCDYCKLTCTSYMCVKCANGEFLVEEYELFQVIKR